MSFNQALINNLWMCINTFLNPKLNQYSTGLFVSYSQKNSIAPNLLALASLAAWQEIEMILSLSHVIVKCVIAYKYRQCTRALRQTGCVLNRGGMRRLDWRQLCRDSAAVPRHRRFQDQGRGGRRQHLHQVQRKGASNHQEPETIFLVVCDPSMN